MNTVKDLSKTNPPKDTKLKIMINHRLYDINLQTGTIWAYESSGDLEGWEIVGKVIS